MYFKNARLYRLDVPATINAEILETRLASVPMRPCGELEWMAMGWGPVAGGETLVRVVDGQWLIRLVIEEKVLPAAVIDQKARAEAREIEQRQGHRVGRVQLRDIKARWTDELLRKALTRQREMHAWLDPRAGLLCIDTSSVNKAEDLASCLLKAVDGLSIRLVRTLISPVVVMAEALDEAPPGFTVDRDCVLSSNSDEGKTSVRFSCHPLDGNDVRDHLTQGKLPTNLALTWNDRLSFVLTDEMAVKRLRFLDVVKESVDANLETTAEIFDAEFAVMTGELRGLFESLVAWLGGEEEPEDAQPTQTQVEAVSA